MKRYAKNIALVLFKYFPYGGLQRDFFSIAKELKERGHSIKVFTRTWDGAIPSWLDVIEVGEKGITNASKNRKFVENVIASSNYLNFPGIPPKFHENFSEKSQITESACA